MSNENATPEELDRAKEEIIERHEKIVDLGWKYMLEREEGRALLFHLIGKCGVYGADALEPNLMFFNAGMRNIGLYLLGEAEFHDSEAFLKMIQEDTNRKKEIAAYVQRKSSYQH